MRVNKYPWWKMPYIVWCLVLTKVLFPRARFVRMPIDIRCRKYMHIGHSLTTGRCCRIECGPEKRALGEYKLFIGNNVQFNDYVHISAWNKVVIGDDVLLASKIYISDVSHGCFGDKIPYEIELPPIKQPLNMSEVVIGNNTWIGESVSILPGVHIGRCCIIGANSLVNKDIPDYCIAAGIPAKIIKTFNLETKKWQQVKRIK